MCTPPATNFDLITPDATQIIIYRAFASATRTFSHLTSFASALQLSFIRVVKFAQWNTLMSRVKNVTSKLGAALDEMPWCNTMPSCNTLMRCLDAVPWCDGLLVFGQRCTCRKWHNGWSLTCMFYGGTIINARTSKSARNLPPKCGNHCEVYRRGNYGCERLHFRHTLIRNYAATPLNSAKHASYACALCICM